MRVQPYVARQQQVAVNKDLARGARMQRAVGYDIKRNPLLRPRICNQARDNDTRSNQVQNEVRTIGRLMHSAGVMANQCWRVSQQSAANQTDGAANACECSAMRL